MAIINHDFISLDVKLILLFSYNYVQAYLLTINCFISFVCMKHLGIPELHAWYVYYLGNIIKTHL